MTDTNPPADRIAEEARALDVLADIAQERCKQTSHECDWECALLKRSIVTVTKAVQRNELLTSAKNHAIEARDKYARRVIGWREAAKKATAERDAARSRVGNLEEQLAKARVLAKQWHRTNAAIDEALVNVEGVARVERWLEMKATDKCGKAILKALAEEPREPIRTCDHRQCPANECRGC
jgi:hypothetical protein